MVLLCKWVTRSNLQLEALRTCDSFNRDPYAHLYTIGINNQATRSNSLITKLLLLYYIQVLLL